MSAVITDPREPVYRKVGRKYVQCGTVNSGGWIGFYAEGLWLMHDTDCGTAVFLISKLEELPSSAASLAAIAQHKYEIVKILSELGSLNDMADRICRWAAEKGGKP